MRQTAVTFGPQSALFGILTEPETSGPDVPVMLLFNSGLLPRQGPHRMNARIARDLAEVGMASLRFDLSGLGDSQAIGSESGSRAQAVRDLKSAMDWLSRTRGTRRFLVFGICSGALVGYDLAQLDERVAGLTMFDGNWYRSRWTTLVRHYKIVRLRGFGNALSAVGRRIVQRSEAAAPPPEAPTFLTDFMGNPPIESYIGVMQGLVDRGVDVQVIYSGSIIDYYSYGAQFKHVFGKYPFYRKIQCRYEPDVDHTLVTKQAQQRMLEIIRDWGRSYVPEATVR